MRKCDICDSVMTSRRTTRGAPYAYVLGGLPRVGLVGIDVHRCKACDLDAPVIPKLGELHRVLARGFLSRPGPLAGDELRFVRKQAGMSAQEFARAMAIDPSHLSRVENGKLPGLGESMDRFARLILAKEIDPALFKELVERWIVEAVALRKPLRAMRMVMKQNKWREARVA